MSKFSSLQSIAIATTIVTASLTPKSFAAPADNSTPNNILDSQIKSTSTESSALKIADPSPDLPNFHEVHPYLFRGGEPSEEGLKKLKELGVKTIIDLRAPSEMHFIEKESANKLGIHYINLVMDSHAPSDEQVATMLSEIDAAREAYTQKRDNSAVFVHCAHGSDRTGCMLGIWRVARENWDYPTAYKEMRQYYFGPKYIKLSGAVEKYATEAAAQNNNKKNK
jgi:protein tyrosine/serine phosphatase